MSVCVGTCLCVLEFCVYGCMWVRVCLFVYVSVGARVCACEGACV